MVIVYLALPGVLSVWLAGEIEREKSGAWTTRVAVAVWLRVPSLPVKVSVEVPLAVEIDVLTFAVHEGVAEVRLWHCVRSTEAPLGAPATPVSETVPA